MLGQYWGHQIYVFLFLTPLILGLKESVHRFSLFFFRPRLCIGDVSCSVDYHCSTGCYNHQHSHYWNCCSIQKVCFYASCNNNYR